jgi:hypothetical protein
MNAPARLGAAIRHANTLTISELDVVCRICQRRRGEHLGPRGTCCPDDGGSYQKRSTFEPGTSAADCSPEAIDALAIIHARRRGVTPVYRAIRGTVMGPGGPIQNAVIDFELVNRREVLDVWDEVLP